MSLYFLPSTVLEYYSNVVAFNLDKYAGEVLWFGVTRFVGQKELFVETKCLKTSRT